MTTKKLVPRASGEGAMGVADNAWGEAYYDTGNFNKGLFVSGHNITQVIAETVTQGGLGGEWTRNGLDIYYNGGNVGIGVENPSEKLEVTGQGKFVRSSVNPCLSTQQSGSGPTALFMGGNVGIGTTNPGARLTASSIIDTTFSNASPSVSDCVFSIVNNPASEAKDNQSSLQFNLNAGLHNHAASISLVSESATIRRGALAFCTDNGTTRPERMRIDSAGNVGIGVVAPKAKLDILKGSFSQYDEASDFFKNLSGEHALNLSTGGWKNASVINQQTGSATQDLTLASTGLYLNSSYGSKTFSSSSIHVNCDTSNGDISFLTGNGDAAATTKVKIINNGNVGIGTTSPVGKLHVENGDFRIEKDIKATIGFKAHTSDSTSTALAFRDSNVGVDRMTIDSQGNVGIGTTSPGAKLHIQGTGGLVSTKIENTSSSDASINLKNTLANYAISTQAGSLNIIDSTDTTAVRMTITSAGNVGIGATSPSNLLELRTENDSGGMADIALYSDGTNNTATSSIFLGQSLTRRAEITAIRLSSGNDHELAFSTNLGAASPVEAMRIDCAGNVGIGTAKPQRNLDIYNKGGSCAQRIWAISDQVLGAPLMIGAWTEYGVKMAAGPDGENLTADDVADYSYTVGIDSTNVIGNGAVDFPKFKFGFSQQKWSEPGDMDRDIMVLQPNGNVGIGTTDPSSPLHVSSENANIISLTRKLDIRNSANGAACKIQGGALVNTTPSMGGAIGLALIDSDGIGTSTNTEGYLYFETKDSGASLTEKMRIDSAGNVGIGTTDPSSRLHVDDSSLNSGNIGTAMRVETSGSTSEVVTALNVQDSLYVKSSGNVGIGVENPSEKLEVTGQGKFVRSSVNPCLSTQQSGSGPTALFMGGNVGIGTTNPGAKLHIQGDDDEIYKAADRLQRNGATLFVYNTSEVNNSYSQLILGNRLSGSSMSRIVSVLLQPGQSELSFSTTKNTVQQESMAISSDGVKVNDLSASADVQTDSNGYFTTTSDKRLKNDLGDCEYGLNEVLQVQPKRYTWKDGPKDANPTVGFFAQDVHDFMPEAAPREAIQNEKGEDDYKWGFHSQTIIAALVNATKEQQQLIEDLKSRIETLENK